MTGTMPDRRAPMTVGFWFGHGPKKVVLPVTFAVLVAVVGGLVQMGRIYGNIVRMQATLDARNAERDKQVESLQHDVKELKEDVAALRQHAITRADVDDLKADIRELRAIIVRGRE